MTDNIDVDQPEVMDELAFEIRAMSQWEEGPTTAWRAALDTSRLGKRLFAKGVPGGYRAAAALLVLGVIVAGVAFSTAGKAHAYRVAVAGSIPASAMSSSSATPAAELPKRLDLFGDSPGAADSTRLAYGLMPPIGDRVPKWNAASEAKQAGFQAGDRQVIRKANLDLKSRDVRATFLKVVQVLSEAQGEYVEQSALTGQNENIQGSLTLRVAAPRLPEVLNQIRGLATVISEASGGEDVTNQVVDLEARLHNEQRVETELLGLMDSRKDAPLKKVLELRESINRVRENIERMTAQRERLSHLVSLATVLVIINPDTTKPAPLPEGLGTYFVKQMRGAWQTSLELLADSLGFFIRVFVGGAFFWLLAGVIVLAVVAIRRRALRRAVGEAAPAL